MSVEHLNLAFNIVSGIGIPILIWALTKQNTDRAILRQEMNKRLDHLDECLDKARISMLERAATRDDFTNFRTEMIQALANTRIEINETITRMREGISNETHGLHERTMRLENLTFKVMND